MTTVTPTVTPSRHLTRTHATATSSRTRPLTAFTHGKGLTPAYKERRAREAQRTATTTPPPGDCGAGLSWVDARVHENGAARARRSA